VSIQSSTVSAVCVLSALSVKTRWNWYPDLGGTGFGVFQSVLSIPSVRQTRWHRVSKTSGTGFGCWMQQTLVINSL
jgi:hypothetical protein